MCGGRFFVVFLLGYVLNLSAIAQENQTPIFSYSFTRIGSAAWGAGGTTVTNNGSAAAFHNPAAVSGKGTHVYLGGGRQSHANYRVFGINVDFENHFVLPSSVIVSRSVFRSHVAVGYLSKYNNQIIAKANLSDILPGLGSQLMESESSLDIHTFFTAGNFPIGEKIKFGLLFGLNYLKDNTKSGSFEEDGTGTGLSMGAGLHYAPLQSLRFGAALKYDRDIKYYLNYNSTSLLYNSDLGNIDRGQSPIVIATPLPEIARFPWSVQVGGSFDVLTNLTLSVMVDFQDWSEDGYSDHRYQYHGGVKYKLTPSLNLGTGFFTLNTHNFDQKFLTAGMQWQPVSGLILSASILDAYLLTNDSFKQRYIMFGFGYQVGVF